ncbi:MAG: NUDIX domain-containing protein [Chloroflexota bacterium]
METLSAFFARYQPQAEESDAWGALRFQVTSYLCAELPPNELITSARAIVTDAQRILVVRDPQGRHILPGGRREPGETPEETVHREVLEETGWTIEHLRLLGVKHFHHLTPKPAGYSYPYPDFLHLIYHAVPGRYLEHARHTDGYELEAGFVPLTALDRQALSASERIFLTAALQTQS